MMEFLSQYGLFLLESITLVAALLVAFAGILAIGRKHRPKLEIIPLNQEYEEIQQQMLEEIKGTSAKKCKRSKKEKKQDKSKPSLYVIDFTGDIKATEVEPLRQAVTAVLSVAQAQDEVLIRLDSPGGVVNGYGLAASQLQRIRDNNLPLTVAIDKIAASGGYLMACVANQIIAAPFAIIGSIGVVGQLPNFHRFLKKHNIDFEMITAGEYKRTLTVFGENTDKGREKFKEDIELIHDCFKQYVLKNRHQLDIDKVSTGEHWLAQDAYDLRLVDALKTSDAFLIDKMKTFNAYQINFMVKRSIADKLLKPVARLLSPWG